MRCPRLVFSTPAVLTLLLTGAAQAQYCQSYIIGGPTTTYYSSRTMTYSSPTTTYYSSPPTTYDSSTTVTYYSPPRVTYYSAPTVTYYSPSDCARRAYRKQPARQSGARPTTMVTVGAYDNYFEPNNINVRPGTTVRWVNRRAQSPWNSPL